MRRSSLRSRDGQVLAGVVIIMVLLMMLVPAIVTWVQQDVRQAVKDQRSTGAFNLAEAGIERGMWKLKSSTTTWASAVQGVVIPGYDFDVTYGDITGGTYRIRFSSGPGTDEVTVLAEGRDVNKREVRALQVVFQNQALPGPLLASGSLTYSGAFETHWGAVLAQNNITVSGNAATEHFPRKFSKQVVSGGTGINARDTNGLNPPNTDNVEWWSDYAVPELPQLDFATMRASAAANGTLNYYTPMFVSSHNFTGYTGAGPHRCNVAGTSSNHPGPHTTHFADSNHHPKSKDNLIWYWDGNLNLTGGGNLSGHSIGLKGTLIVRGNLTIETEDNYGPVVTVPPNAWKEYARIGPSTYDTATTNQYPADNGYQQVRTTFDLGNESWTGGPAAMATDVGFSGFVYVGGNLTIVNNALSDYHGVIWVVGNVTNNNVGERSLLFFDHTLGSSLPVLNVILVRQSWKETAPSSVPWL